MAYNTRYTFRFESDNGNDYIININQKDYTGEAEKRSLGQSPVLKREMNGCICGSSLDIFAECLVDGEFSALYTSDPFEYQVDLQRCNTAGNFISIWKGFVSPELYSEPDIAPPYDVTITAVDGLGELKLTHFSAMGTVTLNALIRSLLSNTGQSLPIDELNTLQAVTPSQTSTGRFLRDTKVCVDYLDGSTCYDVLQTVLESFHAKIMFNDMRWLVFRETDVELTAAGKVQIYQDGSTTPSLFDSASFGSMSNTDWWPIGKLSSEVIPAKKKLTLTNDFHYKETLLENSYMTEDSKWTKSTGVTYDENETEYLLPTEDSYIEQKVTFSEDSSHWETSRLKITIKARCVEPGTEAGKLNVFVFGNVKYGQTSALRYLVKNATTGAFSWSTTMFDITNDIAASGEQNVEGSEQTVELSVPLSLGSGRVQSVSTDALTIKIVNGDSTYTKGIISVTIAREDQPLGYQDILNIQNGARGDADDVSIAFAYNKNGNDADFHTQDGVLLSAAGEPFRTWSTSKYTGFDYISLMARDNALSVALPRLKKTGDLNVPKQTDVPLVFKDRDDILYWLDTYEWKLVDDEMSVELMSAPAAFVRVTETLEDKQNDNKYKKIVAGGVLLKYSSTELAGYDSSTAINLR